MGRPRYDNLIGPESLVPADTQLPLATPAEYQGWQHQLLTERGGVVFESTTPIRAFVNHGRWLATCAWCSNAPLTRPDWGTACCLECGAFYPVGKVSFPKKHREIHDILVQRPKREQQNWTDESLEALQDENERNM